LKEERKNIAAYISANDISVQHSKPEGTGRWQTEDGRDIYFQSSSSLYYHQIELGDGSGELVNGSTAYIRYIGTTLFGVEVYNSTNRVSPDPDFLTISSNPSGRRLGAGFQEAVRNMRVGGHCKVIIPFNIGNGSNWTVSGTVFSDMHNYVPMVYEIWLVGVE
jgi:FKBP-type peptidyl-prolyl cis-trans isomerase